MLDFVPPDEATERAMIPFETAETTRLILGNLFLYQEALRRHRQMHGGEA